VGTRIEPHRDSTNVPTVMVNTGWYQRLRLALRRHDPRRRGLTLPIPIGAGTYARRDEGCNQRNQNLLH
jgi:hypothetical protein